MMKEFNINHNVRVKITPNGELAYNKYYQDLNIVPPTINRDPDGFSTFQMWELFQKFGSSMYAGCDAPFETTIQIEDQYLK